MSHHCDHILHVSLCSQRYCVHARSFAKCSLSHEFCACLQLSSLCSSAATGNEFNTCGNVENAENVGNAVQSELNDIDEMCTHRKRVRTNKNDSERLEENRGANRTLSWFVERTMSGALKVSGFPRRQMPPILVTLGCEQL